MYRQAEIDYLEQRLYREEQAARSATTRTARRAHANLADIYRSRILSLRQA